MVEQLKEFHVTEYKTYAVWAIDADEAKAKFGNYDYIEETDFVVQIKDMGYIPEDVLLIS
jgi:hypothetical protein